MKSSRINLSLMRNDPSSLNFTQHILHCKNNTEKEETKIKRENDCMGERREKEGEKKGGREIEVIFNSEPGYNFEPGYNSKYKLSLNNTVKFSLFCQQRKLLFSFPCYIGIMKMLKQQLLFTG